MLAKRIIPCLDVHEGRVVKGINFVNLRDAGDPWRILPLPLGFGLFQCVENERHRRSVTGSVDGRQAWAVVVREQRIDDDLRFLADLLDRLLAPETIHLPLKFQPLCLCSSQVLLQLLGLT